MRLLVCMVFMLAGCSHLSPLAPAPAPATEKPPAPASRATHSRGHDVALFALGLIDTGYRFGGKNPEAGLDCSGMVAYVYGHSANLKLVGSAAEMARQGRPVAMEELRPGDLVFFNTRNRSYSHVGIYIGNDRFIHAPSSNGKIRAESLSRSWFATRFEEARTYFD